MVVVMAVVVVVVVVVVVIVEIFCQFTFVVFFWWFNKVHLKQEDTLQCKKQCTIFVHDRTCSFLPFTVSYQCSYQACYLIIHSILTFLILEFHNALVRNKLEVKCHIDWAYQPILSYHITGTVHMACDQNMEALPLSTPVCFLIELGAHSCEMSM